MRRALAGAMSAWRRLFRVFAVRAADVFARYAFNLLLAAALGVQGAGQFYLGIALLSVLSSVSRFGIDTVAVKRLAIARQSGDAARARGVAAFACGSTVAAGAVISTLLFAVAPLAATIVFGNPALAPILRALSFGILALAVATTAGSLLSALDRPACGQLVSSVAWPLLTALWLAAHGGSPGPTQAATAAALAMAAAAAVGLILALRRLGLGHAARPEARPVFLEAWPLFGVEATYLLLGNLPILALGALGTDRDVGLFAAAAKVSALLTVTTVAMYAVMAPRLARLHATGDRSGFVRAAQGATLEITALVLPAVAGMLLFPSALLGLFGHAFRPGAPLLVVAAVGQMVNVALSQCHTALAMSGNERWLWRSAQAALIALVALLACLVPAFGAMGAALAASAATLVMSAGGAIGVRRKLGFCVLGAFTPASLARRTPLRPAGTAAK